MTLKALAVPFIAAAGIGSALVLAPAAAAVDPCSSAVSSSRCGGPGFNAPAITGGVQNGPYGPWGAIPPIGR